MIRQDWSTLKKLMFMKAAAGGSVIEDTATGNPLVFTTDKARPLKSLLIPFTPVQSGSGDPSPDNVRPISGWTGLNVWHGGKNLLDKSNIVNGYPSTVDGETVLDGSNAARTVWCECLPNTTYTCHKMTGGQRFGVYATAEIPQAGITLISCTQVQQSGNVLRKVTTPANAKYLCLFVWLSSADTEITAQEMMDSVMVEAGNVTPSAYEPYTGETIPVSFPSGQTIYGGTLDLVTGVLSVTHGIYNSTGNEGWVQSSSSVPNTYRYSFSFETISSTYIAPVCDKFKGVGSYNPDVYGIVIASNGRVIITVPDTITSKEEMQAFIESIGGFSFAYPLATPTTVQLTSEQITALVGDNTVWSDTNGSNTVTFLKKG